MKTFTSFQEALAYANGLARERRKSIPLKRDGDSWIVDDGVSAAVAEPVGARRPTKAVPARTKDPLLPWSWWGDDQLLALKAFYLGHAAAQRPASASTALQMIEVALTQLDGRGEHSVAEAFYRLLRAELLRHNGSPTNDRRHAKEICERIGSELFDLVLRIDEETQTTKRLDGIQSLRIVDDGIKKTDHRVATDGWVQWVVHNDIAAQALGINDRTLSEKQISFLHEVTLLDLLKSNGITYS